MSVVGDKIKRWCQEESLPLVVEQDDETGLACSVSLSGEPPLSISVRGSGPQPSQVHLQHTLELSLPAQVSSDPEGPQRIAAVLERVAAARSGLVECRPTAEQGKAAAEVVVTLHEDGMTKQVFLTALEELRKVARVITWDLEGVSATTEILSDVQAFVEKTEALASEMERAAGDVEEPAPPVEEPPTQPDTAQVEEAPAPAEPSPPPQAPPAPTPPAAAPASLFCPNCGRQAKPEHRFCIGCGTPLDG
jgi:hypothetical protein